ncbi:hypothetical protein F5B19DRAFT_415210 [Rostrohypoxylon terebratum]|nr:hypothetical protein F5B19DRAFT_415210 [Rostrohypoxylon terebratum]
MGCMGISSLLSKTRKKKKSKKTSPTPEKEQAIYIFPNIPPQVYQPHGRHEVYERPQIRPQIRMVRSDFEVPQPVRRPPPRTALSADRDVRCSELPRRASYDSTKSTTRDEPEPSTSNTLAQNRKPQLNTDRQEFPREYNLAQARARRVDLNFLWQDKRDSLDEESILAAKGQRPACIKPRSMCEADCLCTRCLARLFREHKRPSLQIDDVDPQSSFSRASRIPVPALTSRRDSYSSNSSRASSRASSKSPSRTPARTPSGLSPAASRTSSRASSRNGSAVRLGKQTSKLEDRVNKLLTADDADPFRQENRSRRQADVKYTGTWIFYR